MHISKLSKKIFIPLLILLCFLTFLLVRVLTYSYFINRRFRACTNTIFTTDISSNPLNLHYTLAWFWLTIVLMVCLLPSAAAPTTTDRIISRKN